MISRAEKKLYKVFRNVGVKANNLKKAQSINELYLDDFDYKLLVYYFEKEFNVELTDADIHQLTTLTVFRDYMKQ